MRKKQLKPGFYMVSRMRELTDLILYSKDQRAYMLSGGDIWRDPYLRNYKTRGKLKLPVPKTLEIPAKEQHPLPAGIYYIDFGTRKGHFFICEAGGHFNLLMSPCWQRIQPLTNARWSWMRGYKLILPDEGDCAF